MSNPLKDPIKSFQCRQCDRKFSRAEHRSRHELSHNPERPWACALCAATFVRRDLLLRHERTVHKPNGRNQKSKSKQRNGTLIDLGTPGAASTSSPNDSVSGVESTPGAEKIDTRVPIPSPYMPMQVGNGVQVQPTYQNLVKENLLGIIPPVAANPFDLQAVPKLVDQQVFYTPGVTEPHFPNDQTVQLTRYGERDAQQSAVISNRAAEHFSDTLKRSHQEASDGYQSLPDRQLTKPRIRTDYGEIVPEIDQLSHFSQFRSPAETYVPSSKPELDFPHKLPPGSANNLVSSVFKQENSEIHLPYAPAPRLANTFDVKEITGQLSPHPSPKFSQVSLDLTRLQINRYVAAYFNLFHPLIPMLHIQSFDCEQAPLGLLLAICSIGATLCREQAVAELLTYNSKLHIDSVNHLDLSKSDALAHAQCLVISSLYAAFSGSSSQLTNVTSSNQYLLNLVEGLVQAGHIGGVNDDDAKPSHQKWIEDQKIIRVFFCSIAAVTTLNILYNFPSKSVLEILPPNLPLPCSEELWNGYFGNEALWERHYLSDTAKTPTITVGQLIGLLTEIGVSDLLDNAATDFSFPALNQFSVRILGNLMLASAAELPRRQHHDNYGQVTASKMESLRKQMKFWRLASARNYFLGRVNTSLISSSNGPILDLFCQLETSTNHDITRASLFLQALRSQQHPMIPLSHVLLGIAKLRLVLDLTSIRESLQHHDVFQISEAASSCVANSIDAQVLDDLFSTVTACFEVMRVPCVLGIPMTQNHLASPVGETFIGHCLCLGFETTVALVIWCYCVEERMRPHSTEKLTDRVMLAYRWIESTCLDAGHQKIYGSLAPTLAEIAASSYEGIKAWQICATMAASLRQIGEVFASSGSFSSAFISHVQDTGCDYLPYA